jgi:hypothetical protein
MFKKVVLIIVLWCANVPPLQAKAPMMKHYAINLPGYVVRFSLPSEIARKLGPREIEEQFTPDDVSFRKNGFRLVAGTSYDLRGPFWGGAYGSLEFHCMVQQKLPQFSGNVETVEGLESYVRQWNSTIEGRATGCVFSRVSLNGMAAVRREWNRFGDPKTREPDCLEIFSLPLNDELFLDVGFTIMAWEAGRGKEHKWKPKAEALRELIKSTILLETRAAPPH